MQAKPIKPIQAIIEVEKKTKYGNEHIYPVNDQGKAACKVLGQKTFALHNITAFKGMGFVFRQVVQVEGADSVVIGEL